MPFDATWDGSLWDSQKSAHVPAPEGRYAWHLRFEAYSGGAQMREYDTHDWIKLHFTVTVE